MAKNFEMSFRIGGKLASTFSSTFSKASRSLSDLKNQSRQTQRALDQLGSDFRRGKIHQSQYAESTERLTRELKQLEAAQKRISAFKNTISSGLNTAKQVAGIAAVGTAAAATGVALKSLNKAASFEQQMTKVGVIAGASASEMKKLNNTALELGASSSLSASEVAVAMKELASKGMNANKIIGSMPGILAAAESSGEDLAMTSNVVVSALNSFNMKATDANHVADVMAMSANKSAAGVEDLGYSFKYAAPVAKTLGISLEELTASTGILVDKGLSGEQAGTSLRMALIRLSKPPKAAKKALDQLGISVTDKNKKFKSMAQTSDDWNKATKNLTQTQKVQYAATIFGTEAATGMLNLFSAGPKRINEMTIALEKSSGSAKNAAKAMKDNYLGSLEELKGSIESAQIKFATPILPVFQDIFDGLSSTVDKNMGGIEKLGEKVASGLGGIFEPFSVKKPEFDIRMTKDSEVMQQYREQLYRYNKFSGMSFSDKVVYTLDETSDKIEKWASGSGGESMNKIFTKLGEVSAKAWTNAFTGAVKSSVSNFSQGNVFAGLGMGAVANILTGGLLLKGGIGAGKWGFNKLKGLTIPKTALTVSKAVTATTQTVKSGKVLPFPSSGTNAASKSLNLLGKSTKLLSKAALPITVLAEGINIATSKDKAKATVQAGTGIAGSLGGAKLGAVIGTAIAPGIGTAIGGALGGIGGYISGRWLGGKGTDAVRNSAAAQPTQSSSSSINGTNINAAGQSLAANMMRASNNFALLTMYSGMASGQVAGPSLQLSNNINRAAHNFSVLTMYSGDSSAWLVGSMMGIKTSADRVKGNLDLLTMYTGQASGWLASLSGIQSAGNRVIKALNNLEARINSIQLPSPKSRRTSYDG